MGVCRWGQKYPFNCSLVYTLRVGPYVSNEPFKISLL